MKAGFALLLAFLLAGCGLTSPEEQITYEVTAGRYAPGDTIVVRLVNGTDRVLLYNLCFSVLERHAEAHWTTALLAGPCILGGSRLDPGAQTFYPIVLPQELAPGEYRFHTSVEILPGGMRRGLYTSPFRVHPRRADGRLAPSVAGR